jgi:hypothetical protein
MSDAIRSPGGASLGESPVNPPASIEITEIIARIELHRQERAKDSDPSIAGNEALRKLHELLDRERQALQLHAQGTRHSSNIEAIAKAIAGVKKLIATASPTAGSHNPRPRHHQDALQNAARTFQRSKGRK